MMHEGNVPNDLTDSNHSNDSEQDALSNEKKYQKKYQKKYREQQKRKAAQDPKYQEALKMQRKSYQERRPMTNQNPITYADEVSEQLAVHDGFACVEDAMATAADWMIENFESPLPRCLSGISIKYYPPTIPKGSQCLELDLPWFAETMGRHPLDVCDAAEHAERLAVAALGEDDSARRTLREEAVELIEAAPNMLYCKASILYVLLFCSPQKLMDITTSLGGDTSLHSIYRRRRKALRELITQFGGEFDIDSKTLNRLMRSFTGKVLPGRSTAWKYPSGRSRAGSEGQPKGRQERSSTDVGMKHSDLHSAINRMPQNTKHSAPCRYYLNRPTSLSTLRTRRSFSHIIDRTSRFNKYSGICYYCPRSCSSSSKVGPPSHHLGIVNCTCRNKKHLKRGHYCLKPSNFSTRIEKLCHELLLKLITASYSARRQSSAM
ncbi:hypothetical protein BU16DRAFT_581832 [Lophium mytilinum]|uniref:Uncharacterized protein n=1 Tax=Lophium mytilinum TaxID=390894 RepID=A0A6A6QSX9_9PEZI|nr:hypothetical protein BU16DRAFT_581832 [Lophium mytilinum]